MTIVQCGRARGWLIFCVAAFAAAVVGAVYCGEKTPVDAAHAERLHLLIYAHFAMAQAALAAGALLLYAQHRIWRRNYLIISYNERGVHLNPPGIRMPTQRVYRCHLGGIRRKDLPPPGAPVVVYPMFMLSGRSSGEKLDAELRKAYAGGEAPPPELYYQPVLGASPWLARAAAQHLLPLLRPGSGVLVVAHGASLPEPPPEPALFCRRLRELLPGGTEVRLTCFGSSERARDALAQMTASHVLLLPFLLTEGLHTQRDLPTQEEAAACGKTLQRLPVAAALLDSSCS